MNKVIISGRLTRDPDIRWTQGQDQMCIARYTLAVDRRGQKKEGQQNADFISCIAFKKGAEFAEKFLHQGTKIMVTGRIQTGSYQDRNGNKVYTTDVIVEEQEFAESKKDENPPTSRNNHNDGWDAAPSDIGEGFMNIPDGVDGEELPWN